MSVISASENREGMRNLNISMIMNPIQAIHDQPVDVFFPLWVVGERLLSRLAGSTTLDDVPELLSVKS